MVRAMTAPVTAATRSRSAAELRGQQGDEAGGEGSVQAERRRIADGVSAQRPHECPGVPEHEHVEPGGPERGLGDVGIVLGGGRGGGLVHNDLGGEETAGEGSSHDTSHCHAVDRVAARRSRALPRAVMPEPPAPTTATAANWEAPVKTNRDMAHVWARVSPAVVASTPKVIQDAHPDADGERIPPVGRP